MIQGFLEIDRSKGTTNKNRKEGEIYDTKCNISKYIPKSG